MTDDLVAFLRARLKDDQDVAESTRQASLSWRNFDMDGELRDDVNAGTVCIVPADEDRAHIARWDPQRVIAEVAAKRRIIDAWQAVYDDIQEPYTGDQRMGEGFGLDHAVQCLATAYADHPDFREEWKP